MSHRFQLVPVLYGLMMGATGWGQTGSATSPLVFENGNTVDVSSYQQPTPPSNTPEITNPFLVLGTGGTLTNTQNITIQCTGLISGTGPLTLNFSSPNITMTFGDGTPYEPEMVITCGLTMQAVRASVGYGSATIEGPLVIAGDSRLGGGFITLTSNSISGSAAATLDPDSNSDTSGAVYVFTGSGSIFNCPSAFGSGATLKLDNSSGTQTFSGSLAGPVYRTGLGGTTVISGQMGSSLSCQGGTVVLSGAAGRAGGDLHSNFGINLAGGSLVLDNSTANNNDRVPSDFLNFNGGNLTLIGVDAGATNQLVYQPRGTNQTTGPAFALGLNRVKVQAGAGNGSSAAITFSDVPTSYDGCVDFEGLATQAQVFFIGMTAGPIAPWVTFNQTDFAAYDTTAGVIPLPTTGRPAQIALATATDYVLGSGAQTALTADGAVQAVTMNGASTLALGGHKLALGAWIQNSGAGAITTGSLTGVAYTSNYQQSSDIVFNANADLTLTSVKIININAIKNGAGTMTWNGTMFGAYGVGSAPSIFVSQGTLALNLTTPLYNNRSYLGYPCITVGTSAGGAASAILSLLADNQFLTSTNPFALAAVKVLPAGEFDLHGHNATLQFLENDGGLVDLAGGVITAGAVTGTPVSVAGRITSGTLNLTGAPTITVGNMGPGYFAHVAADGLIISSKIVSPGALTKAGIGTLDLTNATNSFGDGTTSLIVTEGTVALQSSGAVGSSNQIIQVTNYGELRAKATGVLTLTNPIQVGPAAFSGTDLILAGGITQTAHGQLNVANTTTVINYTNNLAASPVAPYDGKTGPGTLILSGAGAGTTTVQFSMDDGVLGFDCDTPLPAGMVFRWTGGTLEAVNNPHTISFPLAILNNANFAGSQPLTFSAVAGNTLSGLYATRAIYVNGTGPVTINNLTGQNNVFVKGGTGTLVLAGAPTGLLTIEVTNGTLRVQNATQAGPYLEAPVTLDSSGTLDLSNGNATVTVIYGSGILNLGAGNLTTYGGTFSGSINGSGGMVKIGTGSFVLLGTTLNTGTTMVNEGGLEVDGTSTTSPIMINGGTLQGSGVVGNVALTSGSIAPGGIGTVGTLSANQVVWNPGGVMQMDLGLSGTSDRLNVTQSLQKGGAGTGTGYTFLFNTLSSYKGNGTFDLITFGGGTTFSASDFAVTGPVQGTFSIHGNTLQFTVTTSYSAWQSTYFSSQLGMTNIVSPTSAPYHDGVPNLVKYALGINPSAPMTTIDRAPCRCWGPQRVVAPIMSRLLFQ